MMYVQYFLAVILGTIGLCASLVQNRYVIKPAGPKICEHHCIQKVGCSSYLFNTVSLSCHLTNDGVTRPDLKKGMYLMQVVKNDERDNVSRKLKCRKNAKMYFTRKNRLQCRSVWPRNTAKRTYTRILILLSGRGLRQARQLYLHNNSIAPYPLKSADHVSAVAYIASSNILLIATWKPRELFSVRVDSDDKTILRRDFLIAGIAVDDVHHLVFLTSVDTPPKLNVMTTEGENFKTLTTMKYKTRGIAVDPKRSLVHVVIPNRGIERFTYNGITEGSTAINRIGKYLTLDIDRDLLYYMKGNPAIISKMFLSNYSSTKLNPTPLFVCNIYSYGNYLYVSKNTLTMILISKSGTMEEVKTGLILNGFLHFCAIP